MDQYDAAGIVHSAIKFAFADDPDIDTWDLCDDVDKRGFENHFNDEPVFARSNEPLTITLTKNNNSRDESIELVHQAINFAFENLGDTESLCEEFDGVLLRDGEDDEYDDDDEWNHDFD